MKNLVVGGCGFLGASIARELVSQGEEVIILDYDLVGLPYSESPYMNNMEGVSYIYGNMRNIDTFHECNGIERIFYAAGILGTSTLMNGIRQTINTNIFGAFSVMEFAVSRGIPLVNLGLIPRWQNPYMLTKNFIQDLGQMYSKYDGADVRTIQLTHAYGPRQNPYQAKAVPNFIIRSLLNRNVVLFGKKDEPFKNMDLIFVTDAAKDIVAIANNNSLKGKNIQLGSGEGISVKDLAQKIISMCDSGSDIIYRDMRKGEPEADSFLHADMHSWYEHFDMPAATVSLDEGLRITIDWYKNKLKTIDERFVVEG